MARILVPLDESPLAEESLPWAAMLARAEGATVHLLSVIPSEAEFWEMMDVDPRKPIAAAQESLQGYLAAIQSGAVVRGVRVTTEVRDGDPAEQITLASAEGGTSLIAVTTRGRGDGNGPGFGSVTDRLVRRSVVPVMVVPPGTAAEAIHRIVVPLDGSREAERALEPARRLAKALGAQVALLRAIDPGPALRYPEFPAEAIEARLRERAVQYLDKVAGPNEDRAVVTGRPAAAIDTFAKEEPCELIVMATHGRGGAVRLELGSVSDAVIRQADRPVFLVRVPAPAM